PRSDDRRSESWSKRDGHAKPLGGPTLLYAEPVPAARMCASAERAAGEVIMSGRQDERVERPPGRALASRTGRAQPLFSVALEPVRPGPARVAAAHEVSVAVTGGRSR